MCALRAPALVLAAMLLSSTVEVVPGHLHAQAKPAALPELVYICPMVKDSDVAMEKPGKCPKCGMVLVPARITQGFTCINHEVILQEQPGLCRIDKRELVSVAISVYFTCAGKPDEKHMEPGKCDDGTARVRRIEKRPHADHNPRHGGILYMADTGWHHLEGTYPAEGSFRVFFYDELTKPMPAKGFTARAVVVDQAGKEIESSPMKPGRIANTLEGSIKSRAMPLRLTLRVKFKPDDKERPFDFQFNELTKEPQAPSPAVTTTAQPAPAPPAAAVKPTAPVTPVTPPEPPPAQAAAQPPAQAPPTTIIAPPVGVDGSTVEQSSSKIRYPLPLPGSSKELLAMLTNFTGEIQKYLDEGSLGAVWQPSLNAKDVALGLDDHKAELPESRRVKVSSAVREIVRAAWDMESTSELGDKQRLLAAHRQFMAAVTELVSAYGTNQ